MLVLPQSLMGLIVRLRMQIGSTILVGCELGLLEGLLLRSFLRLWLARGSL